MLAPHCTHIAKRSVTARIISPGSAGLPISVCVLPAACAGDARPHERCSVGRPSTAAKVGLTGALTLQELILVDATAGRWAKGRAPAEVWP